MTPADLRRLLEPLDPAGTVTVGWLLAHLDADGGGRHGEYAKEIAGNSRTLPPADLTVAELAARCGRHPSTVRAWIEPKKLPGGGSEPGKIPGAYQDHARRWRIPVSALLQWEASQREPKAPAPAPRPRGKHDLSTWRRSA